MIIWSGWGILVPVFVFIAFIGTALLGDVVGATNDQKAITAMLLASVACWFVGRYLNDPSRGRVLLDEETGESVVVQKSHTLFWIEVQWWAVPCLILAVTFFFQ